MSKETQNPNENLKSSLSSLENLIQLSESIITNTKSILTCPSNHIIHCQKTIAIAHSSTFFYQNCPSVVSLPNPPLNLPPFLDNQSLNGLTCDFQFLPSEYMFVKRETDSWIDFPSHYSFIIRRVVLSLAAAAAASTGNIINSGFFLNSPLTIDVSLRDHVLLLLRFCFTPIINEAIAIGLGDPHQFYFHCPVFSQVLAWYSTQLGILFGQTNAKLFAIHLFKHLILNLTINFFMFTHKTIQITKDHFSQISVSQLQQAVDAFRHRSLLQQNIKAFPYSSHLNSSHQRASEHEYISKRAEEERLKRPDYQPIIEHDLFSWQRGRNKDTSSTKSREELLAEERDYKRRRMSYRGKKIKRTTTQVMRDIIEQYTEEIKAAGGFGHLQHVAEESGEAASDFPVCNKSAENVMEKGQTNSSDAGSAPTYNRTRSHSYEATRSTKIVGQYPKDLDRFKHNQKADTNRYDRNHNCKSPEKVRNSGRRQCDVTQVHKKSSSRSPEKNNSSSREHSRHMKERLNGTDDKSRYERSLGRSHKSDSVAHKKFKDRYDPSESWNTDEENP